MFVMFCILSDAQMLMTRLNVPFFSSFFRIHFDFVIKNRFFVLGLLSN